MMQRFPLAVMVACALFVASTNFAQATIITGTQNFQVVARLTGPVGSNSINPTWQVGVQGTDLGHMVNHNGKTYFLFGDTFDGPGNQGSGGPDWRHNVMAWTTDTNPADGITFDGWLTRPNGTARQAIVPGFEPTTYIPTGAVSVGDKIYAWYMHVSNWATGWTLSHSGLASWREGDPAFTTVPGFRFEAPGSDIYTTGHGSQGPGNFGMVAAAHRSPLENVNDPHVYIWGTPGGREGGVKLARVLPDNIEDLAAYQFYNGTVNGVPQWVDNEFAAQRIIPSRPEGGTGVGEMSVMYNEAMRAWTMTSISGGPTQFHIRYAENPWGPWSAPVNIPVTNLPDRWGPYAPYMNPLYVEDGGRTIYFTMSYWEPYDVYLAKVDLNLDFRTRWTGNVGQWAADPNWSHGPPTEEHRATLDNGGTIRLNSAASVRSFDVGTQAGSGGTVIISIGGELSVHDGGFRLAQAQGSQGALAMLAGSVEVLDPTRLFIIGDRGSATANVSGGTVTAQTFSIGHQPTSTGHLELSGGAVINTTGDRFQLARLRNIATGERSVASLTMTGGTINVNNTGTGVADFVPAFEGVATVDISGGTINVGNNFVAAVVGASGSTPRSQATITHSGGTINTGGMTLGERGISDYTLSGSAQINARGLMRLGWFNGSQSTLTQNGGAVEVATENPSSTFVGLKVGEGGEATYTINGGSINVPGRLWIAELPSSVGRMNVHGGIVAVGANFAVGQQGDGRLTHSAGQLSVGGSLHIAAGFGTSVGIHQQTGGTLSVADTLNVGRDNGAGMTHISGGSATVDTLVRVWSTGTLTLSGGTLATPTLRHNEGGTFNFTGGTLHVGTFTGNLTNAGGTLAPGAIGSASTTSVTGNYIQQAGARLAIEIGGLSAGSEHDQLSVAGSATLGGQLELALVSGFLPQTDQTFTILTAADFAGTFNNIASGERLMTGDGMGTFLVHYGAESTFSQNHVVLSEFQYTGDFNGDGIVDAADYVIWRRAAAESIMNETHYEAWRTNFGTTIAGSSTGASAAVPEPTSLAVLVGLALLWLRYRGSRSPGAGS